MFGVDPFAARVEHEEAARAVGVLAHPRLETRLPEKCGLLIPGDSGDRSRAAEQAGIHLGNHAAGGLHLRERFAGDAEAGEDFFIPSAGVDVEDECAGGVADVNRMNATSGQFPDQPTVHGAEAELSGIRQFAGLRSVLEDPVHFGAGKIGIGHQSGLASQYPVKALLLEFLAEVRCATALPVDRRTQCLARLVVPCNGGFTLVGDAHCRHVCHRPPRLGQCLGDGLLLAAPDFLRMLLHPTGLRIAALQRCSHTGNDFAGIPKQDRPGTGGALIKSHHDFRHVGFFSKHLHAGYGRFVRCPRGGCWNQRPQGR